jgi:hypothetical protein
MRKSRLLAGRILLACALAVVALAPPLAHAQSPPPRAPEIAASSSLLFIENVGQFDPAARFLVRGGGATLWLAQDALWLTVMEPAPPPERSPGALDGPAAEAEPRQGVHLRLSFLGANRAPEIAPFHRSETIVSYFYGNDPDAWRPDVPVWQGVRYVDLYPGLDLEITGDGGRWAWRMVATDASAALDAVQLRIEGAEALALDRGALRIETALGPLALPLLEAVDAQGRALAAGSPRLQGESVAAPFGEAAASDGPVGAQAGGLLYSTYLGGSGQDEGKGIAVDGQGRAYVTGRTYSATYPTTPGAYDTTYNQAADVFVSVLNPSGTALVYSTFLGGPGDDRAEAIAVDASGRAYVTGWTGSSQYPHTPGAYDTTINGDLDAFVTVLDPTGAALVYSTFLGGTLADRGYGIAVDGAGRAYVTGRTVSTNYPTTEGAYDRTYNGGDWDAFVTVLEPTGSALVYSTFLGGPGDDRAEAIAVDALGRAYVTGYTKSTDYPTTDGAYDTTHNGDVDVFVSVLNPTGSALVYSTFLGGSSWDGGYGIAVDGAGQAYVTGFTYSANHPTTPGAYDTTHNGHGDVFVSVLDPTGAALVYSTLLGGSGEDYAYGIAVDSAGRAYIAGATYSANYPTTPGAYDSTYNGDADVFVSVLDPTGEELMYSTFVGSSTFEWSYGIAVSSARRAYVTGYTLSGNYPTTPGAFDTTHNGNWDVFVSALDVPLVWEHTFYLPITRR